MSVIALQRSKNVSTLTPAQITDFYTPIIESAEKRLDLLEGLVNEQEERKMPPRQGGKFSFNPDIIYRSSNASSERSTS
jgi:hypothetical protein